MKFDDIRDHFSDYCVTIHSSDKIETLDVAVVNGKIYLISVTKKVNKEQILFHHTSIHIYEEQENKEFAEIKNIVLSDHSSGMRGPRCYSHYNKQYMLIENNLYYFLFGDNNGVNGSHFHLHKINLIDKQTSFVKTVEIE